MMINFIKIGDINGDGMNVYICNEKKIGHSYLYNFYTSLDRNSHTYDILSKKDELCLNYDNCVFISNFEIYEDYRGSGYGKELLKRILDLTNTFNIEYVFLNCKINNIIAQKLYKSFGFEKYGSNDVDDVLIYKIPKQ
jgi:RimJ/RimL family protein N-acetyltransferase